MKIAYWQKGTYDKDQTGANVIRQPIRTIEINKTRFDSNPTDGIVSHDWTIVLQSDTPKAIGIVAGDIIIYDKHKYAVQKTEKKKNRTAYNNFDIQIFLK